MAKILVVDDSMVARMCLQSCIPPDEGHEVAEAADGLSGLETFRTMQPDVTFLDLTMPVMSGTEMLAEIRKDFPKAIIIICTADIQKQSLEKVTQLGAFGVLKKPPGKEAMLAELRRALSAAEGADE
jgi:two-component system, chemotaxis family, chemotaxis protein CheY